MAAPSSLLSEDVKADGALPGFPHFAPKAKRVIYLFQHGAPSQLDLFDYKPELGKQRGTDLPDSVRKGQRLTGMTAFQTTFPTAPSIFKFAPNGQSGMWLSELLPHTAKVADQICLIKSLQTEAINHDPAVTFFQTGFQIAGRPSIGSWISYGLGSENRDLPTFVVMVSQGVGNTQAHSGPAMGKRISPHTVPGREVPLGRRSGSVPLQPARIFGRCAAAVSRRSGAAECNRTPGVSRPGDRHANLPIRGGVSYAEVRPRAGRFFKRARVDVQNVWTRRAQAGDLCANCILARRLVERGVRFIQIFHRGWDQHGNLPKEIRGQCLQTDQPTAALIQDLAQRGMLDDTLVVWGGEFGRTVYSQGTLTEINYGRDHHPRCFSVWMAGGGIKRGLTYGETDDYSYNVVKDPVEVFDLHATILHCLRVDHTRLTYKFQGKHFRLTDVKGSVIRSLLV